MKQLYKILIVEDLISDAELILYELRKASIKYDYKRVEREDAFRRALEEFDPDIILADFSLPRFNALTALEIIKELKIIIPFILVTGSQSEEIAVQCIKNGADDYLLKTSLTRLPTAFYNSIRIKEEVKIRQEAENRLRESEAYKSAILNTAADGIITIDQEGNIDLFNNAAQNLFGYENREVHGHPLSLIFPELSNLDTIAELDTLINKRLNTYIQTEFTGRKKDGTRFYTEISVDRVVLPERSFFVAIIRDITLRKKAEENIKFKNRELNTFVYRVSHDLKGPISSILGLVDVASGELRGNPEAMRYNKLIGQSASKLDYTLVELLKVLHVREAEVEYDIVNIHDLIHEIIKLYGSKGLLETIYTKIEVPEDLEFFTSRHFLHILLDKIILNAIHFRKDFYAENFILVKSTLDAGRLVITVKDNGIGMEEAIQLKAFDMFFRGNNISKGSGLGLYLAKIAIEKMNGSIDLKSEKEKGTTVKVTIPPPVDAQETVYIK